MDVDGAGTTTVVVPSTVFVVVPWGLEVGRGVNLVTTGATVVVVLPDTEGRLASPSSPSSSSGLSVTKGQLLADVVVADAVMSQPRESDELVVLQLTEPDVREVQET